MNLRLPGRKICAIAVLFVFTMGLRINKSFAESLAVTLSVGDTYFVVNGFTSPGAMIYVKEGTAVVATAQAAADGTFTASVLTDPGLHDYSLYAVDTTSLVTATYTQTVSLTASATTTVGNLVLPPTISAGTGNVVLGSNIVLTGQTVPSSQIYIFIDNVQVASTTSQSDGTWSSAIETTSLGLGTYAVVAKTQITGGYTSENSSPLSVSVRAPNPSPTPNGGSSSSSSNNVSDNTTTSNTSSPLTSSAPKRQRLVPNWFAAYDHDGNGILTMRDLSGIVTSWATSLRDYLRGTPPHASTGSCDLNTDKKCDLYDFSILLYYIDRQV